MTAQNRNATKLPKLRTWADVQNHPGLTAISIAITAFGETTHKEWVKRTMDPAHWERIVSIAETTANKVADAESLGYSWVDAVIVDNGFGEPLAPPAHLQALIRQDAGTAAAPAEQQAPAQPTVDQIIDRATQITFEHQTGFLPKDRYENREIGLGCRGCGKKWYFAQDPDANISARRHVIEVMAAEGLLANN